MHQAVAGYDPRGPSLDPQRISTRTGRVARRLVARRLRERVRRRSVVPARSLGRHDQARGQASRPGRSRDSGGRPPERAGISGDRRSRRVEGRSAVGLRRAGGGTRNPATRCAGDLEVRHRRASALSFKPAAVRFTTALPKKDASAKVLLPRHPVRLATAAERATLRTPRIRKTRRDRGEHAKLRS